MKIATPTYLVLSLLMLISISCLAQDWPNLERYQSENETLAEAVPGKNRIVFMGNSITEGWKEMRPDFFVKNHYVNRGISGQTTPQMLVRFRQDVLDLKPAAVVILAGINDIAGNTGPSSIKMIADNIKSMAELAQIHGINVIIASVLPANDFPWSPNLKPAQKVIELNSILKSYAERNSFVYLDYFTPMVDSFNGLKQEYTYDGVHPNEAGYQLMEPLAKAAIGKYFVVFRPD